MGTMLFPSRPRIRPESRFADSPARARHLDEPAAAPRRRRDPTGPPSSWSRIISRFMSSSPVFDGWVYLIHLQNRGVAFSLFGDSTAVWRTPLLIVLACGAIAALVDRKSTRLNSSH